jgi:hypothetical protein
MPSVFAKELGIHWKQFWIQDLQNTRKVNLCVFRIGMIAMDQECGDGQQRQNDDILEVQSVGFLFPRSPENYNRKHARQEAAFVRLVTGSVRHGKPWRLSKALAKILNYHKIMKK